MLYHTGCSGRVYAVVTPAVDFLAQIIVTDAGLSVTEYSILQNKQSISSPKLICSRCKKTIKTEEIVSQCRGCGELEKISELKFHGGYNDFFCRKCWDRNKFDSEPVNISEFFSKLNLSNGGSRE